MTIKITLKTDNAAFQDGNMDLEIQRILRKRIVEDWPFDRNTLVNSNGNTVGSVVVTGR